MKKILLFDFSRVLLFPKDKNYNETLNGLYRSLLEKDKFNFFEYFTLNQELLDFLKTIKNQYQLFILTSDVIQNAPEIRDTLHEVFKEVYSAKDLGLSKKDPEIYRLLTEKLQKTPDEIIFIDDTLENVQAAQKAGLQSIHFISTIQLIRNLQNL